MKKNVGKSDKILRIIIAMVAGYFAYKGGFDTAWKGYALWAVAGIMVLTSFTGSCPLYSIFGMNTCKIKK